MGAPRVFYCLENNNAHERLVKGPLVVKVREKEKKEKEVGEGNVS